MIPPHDPALGWAVAGALVLLTLGLLTIVVVAWVDRALERAPVMPGDPGDSATWAADLVDDTRVDDRGGAP